MNIYKLFLWCITQKYLQVGLSANFAVKRKGTTLYIFFESSKGKNDWKTNFDFPAKPYKRMSKTIWFAHRGFLKQWKEIEPFLKGLIMQSEIKKIVIVGYSLGAGVAVLCHEYVWFNRPDLRKTLEGYGFACPRVFWGIKCPRLTSRWANFKVVRNLDDIVTHLPPFLLGYSHVGKMLKIGKRGKYSPFGAHKKENILNELKIYVENQTSKTK